MYNSRYTINQTSYAPNKSYNPLENMIFGGYTSVSMDSIDQQEKIIEDQRKNHYLEKFNSGIEYTTKTEKFKTKQEYPIFVPSIFLNTNRPQTKFVGDADEIRQDIIQAFEETTGKIFPNNIVITIADKKTLAKKHKKWQEGILGFSINANGAGVSEVFVLKGEMDQVMLTMGHELGHVISPTLPDARDEEAKAYAFSLAWMKVIIQKNIGNLKHCINPNPAQNGLHDVAFNFVSELLQTGKNAMEVFHSIREGNLSIKRTIEQIIIN